MLATKKLIEKLVSKRKIVQTLDRQEGTSFAKMYIVSENEAYLLKKNLYRNSPNYCIEGPLSLNKVGAKIPFVLIDGKKFWGASLSWELAEKIFLDAINCRLD